MGGKKRKGFYVNQHAKKQKNSYIKITHQLCPGMKGFYITYNSQYTFCLNEAKRLLKEYAVLKPANEEPEIETAEQIESDKRNNEEDLEKLLKAELSEIKKQDDEFKIMDAGAKYTIFMTLPNIKVNETIDAIFQQIETTKRPLGRYVQRFVPVLNTCKAHLENIEKCIDYTFNQVYNSETAIKYSCQFKTSNNGSVSRDDVIKLVNTYFRQKNANNKIDHDNPDYVILIQVIRNICFVSYLKNFFDYRKYNLIEMGIKCSDTKLIAKTETNAVEAKNAEDEDEDDDVTDNDENEDDEDEYDSKTDNNGNGVEADVTDTKTEPLNEAKNEPTD